MSAPVDGLVLLRALAEAGESREGRVLLRRIAGALALAEEEAAEGGDLASQVARDIARARRADEKRGAR